MITTMNAKFSGHIRIGPFLNILDMGSVYSNRNVVF